MRLIDADKLKEECHWVIRSDGTRVFVCHDFDIDDAPTIDAEPVKHGHWDSNGCCTSCGECAVRTEWDTPVYDHWNGISRLSHFDHHVYTVKTYYCPHCGAKMDEEDNT